MSDPDGYASPACGLHEVDDGYLGYFTRDEIIPRLMALHAAAQALAADERTRAAAARWSATLAAHLAQFGAGPSSPPETEPAAARVEMTRGLAELIPKVRNDALHADLKAIAAELGRA